MNPINAFFKLLNGLGLTPYCFLDLQFYHFLRYVTNLTKSQIMLVFDLLDWEGKGEIGFDEFYMLACIIMAHEVSKFRLWEGRRKRNVILS